MALVKWEPFSEFDRFFNDFPSLATREGGWDLSVDLYEEGGNVVAQMNVPGVDPDKLDISVEDNFLRIAGSREDEQEKEDKHYYSKEIRRGGFERVVRLPQDVERKKVEATYDDGVLKVVMPKKEPSDEDKIKVQVKK